MQRNNLNLVNLFTSKLCCIYIWKLKSSKFYKIILIKKRQSAGNKSIRDCCFDICDAVHQFARVFHQLQRRLPSDSEEGPSLFKLDFLILLFLKSLTNQSQQIDTSSQSKSLFISFIDRFNKKNWNSSFSDLVSMFCLHWGKRERSRASHIFCLF
jgi:hypothetical protein